MRLKRKREESKHESVNESDNTPMTVEPEGAGGSTGMRAGGSSSSGIGGPSSSSDLPAVSADPPLPAPLPQSDQQPPDVDMATDQSNNIHINMLAQVAIEYINYGAHVSEVYSPLRVGKLASKLGLSAGTSFDLTQVDPDDGQPWELHEGVEA